MSQQKTTRIVAEFHYWSYGQMAETAMLPRPEVREEDLERIAKKHNVTIDSRRISAAFWSLGRIGWPRLPRYSKVILQVIGYEEDSIKNCLKEVFNLYGRPDEVPPALFGEKRTGKRIIESVLKDYAATY